MGVAQLAPPSEADLALENVEKTFLRRSGQTEHGCASGLIHPCAIAVAVCCKGHRYQPYTSERPQ